MNRFATLVARGVADQFSPRHRASALRRLRTTPAPVRRGLHLLPVAFLAILASTVCAQNTNVFELRDGDRVVFLGDTFFEREQTYGHIEYLLTTHYPERHVTFRNLGWSADTPLGLSRSGFGFPTEGLHRLRTNDLVLAKPTVAFLSYGMTASFAGAAGLSNFVAEMEKLMDLVQEAAGTNPVRFVLLSPIRHERHPPPMPDPARHNEDLQRYTDALRQLAGRRQAHFVNLFEALNPRNFPPGLPPLTDDGIHLTEHGYRRAAEAIGAAFRWESHIWRVGILANGQVREGSFGVTVHELSRTTNSARLVATLEQLVPPPDPALTRSNRFGSSPGRVQLAGAPPGKYELRINGRFLRNLSDLDLRSSFVIDEGAPSEQAAELLHTIRKKNELFFHRYRPQNNTYLFLFRRHEQGQNAKEIPQFDPLIAEQEKRIATLRRPPKFTLEIQPSTGANPTPVQRRPAAPPVDPTPLPHPAFDLDADLQISLWAENPLLAKPIQINFDPQGRLWVASSEVYPQIRPGQEATDRILVLEDADGDGRAEKSTVFAEGLLIPTGVEPGDGGAYVGQSTELLHLKDTDGDGRADTRRVMLAGFGTEDTHHIVHTLRWGHDGQLHMNQSIYIHTHTETPHGVVRLNSGGTLSLRPGTMELGILMKGLVNSWGHALDRFGQSFVTDGAGGDGISWVVPQGMYNTYERARRLVGSISPGAYPKFCSLEIVHSEHFPPEWQGHFITCDFRAHRVVRFGLEEKGSAYVTREQPDVARTRDVAFRPVDVKIGPDGALYIADWSNPIIQHGEVDFRDPRRDREHGRIWRVTHKRRPLVARVNLTTAASEALLDHLTSPNDFHRNQARRVLIQRGATNVLPALTAWAARQTNDAARLEALWLHQALDVVEPALLRRLLDSPDPRVRAAATRVLGAWMERHPLPPLDLASSSRGWAPAPLPLPHRREIPTDDALELLAARVADPHPRVRLEALRALARIPRPRAIELALTAADQPLDHHLDYALWLTVNDLADTWIAALKSGAWKPEGRDTQLAFGLKAIEPARAGEVLGQLLGDKPLARDGSGPWIDLIGQAGTARELDRLFQQILDGGFDEAAAARALAALAQAARLRNTRPPGDLAPVNTLLDSPHAPVRLEAIRLAGAWKGPGEARARLLALAGDTASQPALREAAFAALREIGGHRVAEGLLGLAAKSSPPDIRRTAVLTLAAVDMERAVAPAVALLTETTTDADALATWRALLNVKGAAAALARALPKAGIPQPVARAGLRAAREGGRNEPDLVLALSRGAELDQGEVSLTDAELRQMVADVQRKGDPARGEAVYRRKELSCVACHAIGGAGGKVGPDLTSIGASAPVDYLIESVWFPNRKIKEGYHALMIETKDGQEFSGTLVRETGEQVILRDATDKEIAIARSNLQERRVSTLSLMPAGLIDGLTPQERIDLFRFLSELGKPGPFDASKGNVARAWKLRPGLHVEDQKSDGSLPFRDLAGSEWIPAIANVDGRVPAALLREGTVVQNRFVGVTGLYAAAQLQTAREGTIKLSLSGATEGSLWIDGKPVAFAGKVSAELPAGLHTVVLRLDPKKLPEFLRLESSDGTFVVP